MPVIPGLCSPTLKVEFLDEKPPAPAMLTLKSGRSGLALPEWWFNSSTYR
jgi:hypothetical protein